MERVSRPVLESHPWRDLKATGMWHLGTRSVVALAVLWEQLDPTVLEGFSKLSNSVIL